MYNVPFRFNPFFQLNTMQLMRGATAYLEQPDFQAYLTAVFNGIKSSVAN
ncbi:hypothetical protein [Psychrobacter sp. K31L]|nr:hypothetical protein [Psychrobacter sp. K31L]MBP3944727.1 hypothetical protein [Psychrobacter sp. K31L]